MTFKFKVHTATPQAVKDAVNDLVHHFEDTLKYKVETMIEDSESFPAHIRAIKKTKVEVQKTEGKEYDTVNLVKYDEQQKAEEWSRLMCFASRNEQEKRTVNEDDPRREEKVERTKQKLNEQLEEAKEYLWKIKDDEDFEKKSETFIKETITRLERGVGTEFLKFLYQLKRDRKSTEAKGDDKQLSLAKELLNSVKEEDHHIFQVVDEHVCEIILELDRAERIDDYITLREKIAHERVDNYQRKVKIKREETETDIDPDTPRKKEVYVTSSKGNMIPMIYHTDKRCEYLTHVHYEEKEPCKCCESETKDILNFRIGSKAIGFVSEKKQYHDEECLLWVSDKDKELRTVCQLCQEVEDIERALKWSRGNRSTGSGTQRNQDA